MGVGSWSLGLLLFRKQQWCHSQDVCLCVSLVWVFISSKCNWVNGCDCEQRLCVCKAQRLHRQKNKTLNVFFFCCILSFNPSPDRQLRVQFPKSDLWPQLRANWFLPGVHGASVYWSRPWWRSGGHLRWFDFVHTRFRNFLGGPSTFRKLHHCLRAAASFDNKQLISL